jgi:integrase/recombinase XerD
MKQSEVKRFANLYDHHLKLLKLQGKSDSTISAYSRAIRRFSDHHDYCPDKLIKEQLENYCVNLVE